jgi:hypothetical protein
MTFWKLTSYLLVLTIAFVGCEGGPKFLAPAVPPPMSANVLRAAPDTLSLVGFPSVIATDLYRDFMPMAPPDGQPLLAIITFSLLSASDFTGNVSASYVWVVNGDEVWGAPLQMQDPSRYPHDEVVLIAQDGPKWGPGIQVNVVLGLMIEGRGLQLVRLPDATISRTD